MNGKAIFTLVVCMAGTACGGSDRDHGSVEDAGAAGVGQAGSSESASGGAAIENAGTGTSGTAGTETPEASGGRAAGGSGNDTSGGGTSGSSAGSSAVSGQAGLPEGGSSGLLAGGASGAAGESAGNGGVSQDTGGAAGSAGTPAEGGASASGGVSVGGSGIGGAAGSAGESAETGGASGQGGEGPADGGAGGQGGAGIALPPCYMTYGMNFGPYIASGEDPRNGPPQITTEELTSRIGFIAPYTERIRTFSCDEDLADAGRLIHEAGKEAHISAWIGPTSSQAGIDANAAQIACLCDRIAAGEANAVIVGSEVLLRGDATETEVIDYITQVQTCAADASVDISVGYADVYGVLLDHPNVLNAVDVVYANYYPYWEGRDIDLAVAYVDRWHTQLMAASGGKEVVVSETGWPSCGEVKGDAVPSPENAAFYFLNVTSWAQANNVAYFYFEALDEPWKTAMEGAQGACWGVFDRNGVLKTGMRNVFDCETMADNWTNPAIGIDVVDFSDIPEQVTTNLDHFLVAVPTLPSQTVSVNGQPLPETATDGTGNWATVIPLASGENQIVLEVLSGEEVTLRAEKTVTYDPAFSTANRPLVYVDVVFEDLADYPVPQVSGTVVLDPALNAPLGIIPDRHAVGIAPNGSEIYLQDRGVIETALHTETRTLPFSAVILQNSFIVSPDGLTLYARNERLDVGTNTLLAALPGDITTGSTWSYAEVPGGPTISSDGSKIYYANPSTSYDIDIIDMATNTLTTTDMYAYAFISDLALTPDDAYLLISSYQSNHGDVQIYDLSTNEFVQHLSDGSLAYNIGDFAGEIGILPTTGQAVVGGSGNPASSTQGGLTAFGLDDYVVTSRITLPHADNLAVSSAGDVFVSSGENGLVQKDGVDVYHVSATGELEPDRSFYLGVNAYTYSTGYPKNDQIRRILLKE